MAAQKTVLVIGSINVDCTVNVRTLPKAGETIHGSDAVYLPGGKGGNQAVSVAAAKSQVIMISAVGSDAYGVQALESLQAFGVDTAGVLQKEVPTGTAFIFVEESGENLIVVTPGANAQVTPNDAENLLTEFFGAVTKDSHGAEEFLPIVLAQLELPIGTVEQAAKTTEALGGRFILNLAPAAKISDQMLAICNPIIVNEYEASFILGREISSTEDALLGVSELARMAKSAVITLGSKGAVYADASSADLPAAKHVPTKKVVAVDTTGAGDAFVGALTAALGRGEDLGASVEAGILAGTAAVLYFGAQPPKN